MATSTPSERIKGLREQAGISRDELATLAGLGTDGKLNGATIGIWESGKGTTLETAIKVSEVLAEKLRRQRADVLAYIAWG